MAVLEYLGANPEGATVSQVSAALDVEISIVSRLLGTLEADEYVRKPPGSDAR